jgi:hypothetical protein
VEMNTSNPSTWKRKREEGTKSRSRSSATITKGKQVAQPSTNARPICGKCNKKHRGPCKADQPLCFHCNHPKHFNNKCPTLEKKSSREPKNQVTRRVCTITSHKAQESTNLVQGECLINSELQTILFDFGATHSFILLSSVDRLRLHVSKLPFDLIVSTSADGKYIVSFVCSPCFVVIKNQTFCVNLFYLPLNGIDVILSMSWLSVHHVVLDCANKYVIIPISTKRIRCTYIPFH